MYTYVFFIISFLLLTACTPNQPATEQSESGTSINVEQQKRDASIKLEAETALLEGAKVEFNQAENLITQDAELKLAQDGQDQKILLEKAKREKVKAEQDLIESAKIEADKAKALLEQAASLKKDI